MATSMEGFEKRRNSAVTKRDECGIYNANKGDAEKTKAWIARFEDCAKTQRAASGAVRDWCGMNTG